MNTLCEDKGAACCLPNETSAFKTATALCLGECWLTEVRVITGLGLFPHTPLCHWNNTRLLVAVHCTALWFQWSVGFRAGAGAGAQPRAHLQPCYNSTSIEKAPTSMVLLKVWHFKVHTGIMWPDIVWFVRKYHGMVSWYGASCRVCTFEGVTSAAGRRSIAQVAQRSHAFVSGWSALSKLASKQWSRQDSPHNHPLLPI